MDSLDLVDALCYGEDPLKIVLELGALLGSCVLNYGRGISPKR